jgi:hypothetical protein
MFPPIEPVPPCTVPRALRGTTAVGAVPNPAALTSRPRRILAGSPRFGFRTTPLRLAKIRDPYRSVHRIARCFHSFVLLLQAPALPYWAHIFGAPDGLQRHMRGLFLRCKVRLHSLASPAASFLKAIVRLPRPPPPRRTGEGSGMEGAHLSTVYRGLPYLGGQPLPRHMMPWPHRGVRGPRFPSTRARAVGPSESSLRGKCQRCVSGLVVRTGTAEPSSSP